MRLDHLLSKDPAKGQGNLHRFILFSFERSSLVLDLIYAIIVFMSI